MSISVSYTDKHGRAVKPKTRVAVWKGKPDTSPVVAMMHSAILTKSAEGKDAAGNPLAPLAPDTIRRTGKLHSNLRRTGALLGTLKVKANKSSGYIHPTVPYAVLLNWGSPKKGYPRREFLAIGQDVADAVAAEVDRRVGENVEVSFGARRALARGRGLLP